VAFSCINGSSADYKHMRVGNFVAVSALKNSCSLNTLVPLNHGLLRNYRKNRDVASKRLFDLGLLAVYTNSILPKNLVNSPKFSFELRFHYY
jgi:hypothetical protein